MPQNQKEIHTPDFLILLTRKPIKHIYLRVCAKTGRVLVSAPRHTPDAAVLGAVGQRKTWLKRQIQLQGARGDSPEPCYESGEPHAFLGQNYPLLVREERGPGKVALLPEGSIELRVPPGSSGTYRKNLLDRWYRNELAQLLEEMVIIWQERMGVRAQEVRLRRMRSRWGSCNTVKGRVWFNLELAKKTPACIEYVVVHELAHLIERAHNARFWGIVGGHLPGWRELRKELNSIPLGK